MSTNRQFLIEDIVAMSSWQPNRLEVLSGMSDEALYTLWKDLVNLTVTNQG
jgi:menaquinone-dependent protoporphyrinogen IX oxidase